jgi:hypothetical protein
MAHSAPRHYIRLLAIHQKGEAMWQAKGMMQLPDTEIVCKLLLEILTPGLFITIFMLSVPKSITGNAFQFQNKK